ncbi:MAG: 4-hydroxy-tetrahydrodipicolinate reductase [Chitinophagales bacterium]
MKIVLLGYGKMGKAIEEVVNAFNKEGEEPIDIIFKFNSQNNSALTAENLQKADVAIEFTTPATVVKNLKLCIDAGVPVVTGTTGWYDVLNEITAYCNKNNGTLLYAANFSIGVNIFFEINKKLAELMRDRRYKIKVEETHHTQKLDAPSGTAIRIAEQIIENHHRKKSWVNRETNDPEELEIISRRKENIPGTHEVIYTSEADEIKLAHTAFSRKGFAEGALLAARWIKNKKGVFTINDVLGI